MTGIYLKCDECGATLGGEEVSNKQNGLHWTEFGKLQQAARKLGWTGPLDRDSNSDKCPDCSKKQCLIINVSNNIKENVEFLERLVNGELLRDGINRNDNSLGELAAVAEQCGQEYLAAELNKLAKVAFEVLNKIKGEYNGKSV